MTNDYLKQLLDEFKSINNNPLNQADRFKLFAKKLDEKMFNFEGFLMSMKKKRTQWIYKKKDKILNSNDASLKVGFGIVCAHDDNLNLAYESFDAIPGNASQIIESKGLIAHAQNNYGIAIQNLKESTSTKFGAIAHSLSLIELDKGTIDTHIQIHSRNPSDIGQRIIGTIAYNKDNYKIAKDYFLAAWNMKKTEKNLLNLLAAERHLESNWALEEYISSVNPYFLEEPSVVPTQEVINKHIYDSTITVPNFSLGNNLYKVLIKLNK